MNEEIRNKLHTALYLISPLASDRDILIEKMGETIWLLSLEKMLLALSEEPRSEVISALNEDDIASAVGIFETHAIDVEAIIAEVSGGVIDEVVASAK